MYVLSMDIFLEALEVYAATGTNVLNDYHLMHSWSWNMLSDNTESYPIKADRERLIGLLEGRGYWEPHRFFSERELATYRNNLEAARRSEGIYLRTQAKRILDKSRKEGDQSISETTMAISETTMGQLSVTYDRGEKTYTLASEDGFRFTGRASEARDKLADALAI